MNLEGAQILDISPLVNSKLAVFPGDVRFKETFHLSFEKGHHLSLSSIESTMHLGAHTDAPSHYHSKGDSIDKRNLNLYIGLCQVISVDTIKNHRIRPEDVNCKIKAPRVLFKTNSFPDPYNWNSDFMAFSPELIEWLHSQNVKLVGLDTPSVDLAEDKILMTHQKIHQCDMAILEGVVLNDVTDGLYNLVALPLRIENAEATPVRAVLIKTELEDVNI